MNCNEPTPLLSFAEKAKGEFWESLGIYVYGFKNSETGDWDYIGKGTNSRALAHIDNKGYNEDSLWIFYKNIPDDHSAFVIESVLIDNLKPKDNSVTGHGRRTGEYIMSDLSTLKGLFNAKAYNGVEDREEALAPFKLNNPEAMKMLYHEAGPAQWKIFTGSSGGTIFTAYFNPTMSSLELKFTAAATEERKKDVINKIKQAFNGAIESESIVEKEAVHKKDGQSLHTYEMQDQEKYRNFPLDVLFASL